MLADQIASIGFFSASRTEEWLCFTPLGHPPDTLPEGINLIRWAYGPGPGQNLTAFSFYSEKAG